MDYDEEAIILPIKDLQKSNNVESEGPESLPTHLDLPSLEVTNRVTTQIREEPEPAETGTLHPQSEAKPFFTRMLSPGENRHHKRLVAIVPLMLLVVIILFIFAYIAAK